MPFLITAVVLVGLLCVLDLILTFGVIRRLRAHTAQLSTMAQIPPALVLGAGATVGSFEATTVDGSTVASADLSDRTLVGFFSPDCSLCKTELPRFVELAAAHPGGADQVLAVVVGDGATDPYVLDLAPVARVVVAPPGHAIESAFQLRGYPTFALIGEEQVVRVAGSLDSVAASGVAA